MIGFEGAPRSGAPGRTAGSVGIKLGALAALVAASAFAIGGCSGDPEPRPNNTPPPEKAPETPPPAPDEGPKPLQHESMKAVETGIYEALSSDEGGAPNYGAVSEGAGKIRDGADGIRGDMPATLKDEDRVRYEGLVAKLRDQAAALATSADARDNLKTKRSVQQVTTSCVKCHSQFGPGEGR